MKNLRKNTVRLILAIIMYLGMVSIWSCSSEPCTKPMAKCDMVIGECDAIIPMMPCDTPDGYFDGIYTYTDLYKK
tara:strand:- start:3550 stop:3774 length:225 start_codon:yes stop_codon:yes gene_type:complete